MKTFYSENNVDLESSLALLMGLESQVVYHKWAEIALFFLSNAAISSKVAHSQSRQKK